MHCSIIFKDAYMAVYTATHGCYQLANDIVYNDTILPPQQPVANLPVTTCYSATHSTNSTSGTML
eukprot:8114-Heterococcus_DN1.PRE.1